jgi:hypothetical protein
LFGLNKTPIDAPQVPVLSDGGNDGKQQSGGAGAGAGGSPKEPEGYRSEAYSFDSTALERAAKAAKVIQGERWDLLNDALNNAFVFHFSRNLRTPSLRRRRLTCPSSRRLPGSRSR